MPNQNNGSYQDQQNIEGNIQAKSGQKGQLNNQQDKKNADAPNVGNKPADKTGRSNSDNRQ